MLSAMPVLAEGFLPPRSVQKSVSPRFGSAKPCLYRSQLLFSEASRITKHTLHASSVSIPYNRRYFLDLLSHTVTFQNT
jgi:hypothetical protein